MTLPTPATARHLMMNMINTLTTGRHIILGVTVNFKQALISFNGMCFTTKCCVDMT